MVNKELKPRHPERSRGKESNSMGDGTGGIGKQVGDSLKDIGQDLTVKLAKDMFDQVMGAKSTKQPPEQSGTPRQMVQAQKNIQMAAISKQIQQLAQRRKAVTQQAKQQEYQRLQGIYQEKQQKEQQLENRGLGKKVKDIFANFGRTLAGRGKGERRGADKTVG